MAPVDSEPDPEFVTAMTFEDISNVAEVLCMSCYRRAVPTKAARNRTH